MDIEEILEPEYTVEEDKHMTTMFSSSEKAFDIVLVSASGRNVLSFADPMMPKAARANAMDLYQLRCCSPESIISYARIAR